MNLPLTPFKRQVYPWQTLYINGRKLQGQKVKPMRKYLKPVFSQMTNGGRLQWLSSVSIEANDKMTLLHTVWVYFAYHISIKSKIDNKAEYSFLRG